jgi:hypothetical protein
MLHCNSKKMRGGDERVHEPSLGSEIHHRSDIAKNLHIWSREWPALRSTYAPNEIWPKLWQMKLFMNENRVIPISKCIVSLICDIFYFASTQMIRYPYYSEINVRTSYQFVSKHNDRQRFWIASMIQFVKNWRYCCQLRRELKAVIHWLLMILLWMLTKQWSIVYWWYCCGC